MALGEHLRELRRRFLLSVIGLVLGMVVGWILFPEAYALLTRPITILQAQGYDIDMNFTRLGAAFDVQLKVALLLAFLISSPWWLYQVWAFMAPGMTKKERLYALGFVGTGVPLMLTGAGIAIAVMPNLVRVLVMFTPDGGINVITAPEYLTFVMQIIIMVGLAFLLPLVMSALSFLGLVKAQTWIKGWRWAVVGSFAFAAVVTPTPEVSIMMLVAVPLCVLYFAAIGVALLRERWVERRTARQDSSLPTAAAGA